MSRSTTNKSHSRTSIVAHVAVATVTASADGYVDASKARGTAFVELYGAGDQQNYPSVSLDLAAGDQVEVSGHLVTDLTAYNDGPDKGRISLWRGAVGSGTLLNPSDTVLGGSGDNRWEVESLTYPGKRFAIGTAGVHTICWALQSNNSSPRAIGFGGVRCYVQAVRHRSVIIPIF